MNEDTTEVPSTMTLSEARTYFAAKSNFLSVIAAMTQEEINEQIDKSYQAALSICWVEGFVSEAHSQCVALEKDMSSIEKLFFAQQCIQDIGNAIIVDELANAPEPEWTLGRFVDRLILDATTLVYNPFGWFGYYRL